MKLLVSIGMRWWIMAALSLIAVALLSGCATGLPGSAQRSFYNLCVMEGGAEDYCEAWASVEAHKLSAGRVGMVGVVQFPVGR